MRATGGGDPLERVTGEPVPDPLGERPGVLLAVEVERERVPIERRPLDPGAATLDSDRSDRAEQRGPDARAAALRPYVEILEPQARPALPRREGPVEQREADRRAVHLGDQRLRRRRRSEQ